MNLNGREVVIKARWEDISDELMVQESLINKNNDELGRVYMSEDFWFAYTLPIKQSKDDFLKRFSNKKSAQYWVEQLLGAEVITPAAKVGNK